MLPNWEQHSEHICARIRSSKAVLKLILKTKNDSSFLYDWVEYHSKVVGIENLIIADNNSDSIEVLDFYSQNYKNLNIFSFSGLHNEIHNARKFPKLYESIKLSTQWFQIIDTDERVVWVDESGWVSDSSVCQKVAGLTKAPLVPGFWPSCVAGSTSEFVIAPRPALLRAITWGKPLLSSNLNFLPGQRLHNCQFPRYIYKDTRSPSVWVLHLNNLSTDQRLQAIRETLCALGVISGTESYQEISELRPTEDFYPSVGHYIRRFAMLASGQGDSSVMRTESIKNALCLEDGGSFSFGCELTKRCFYELYQDFPRLLSEAMSPAGDPNGRRDETWKH